MSETTVVALAVQSTYHPPIIFKQTKRRSEHSNWTDQAFNFFKQLMAEAKSATVIAAELSQLTGLKFSRNSIISKARREKIAFQGPKTFRPSRPATKPAPRKVMRLPTRQIMPTLSFLEPAAPNEPLRLSIMEMETGQCYWPVTPDGTPTLFCGQPVDIRHNSWCPHHRSIGCEVLKPQARKRPAYR